MPKALLKKPPGFRVAKVEHFKEDMQALGEEIAEDFKEKIIENIETNYYRFELDPATAKRKGSDTPLVDSGELLDAIYRDETSVSVLDTVRESGITNLDLAMILEYGTKDKHIPAFPVWRFTYRDFKAEARNRIIEFFET